MMVRQLLQWFLVVAIALGVVEPAAAQSAQVRLWEGAIAGDTVALAAALTDGARVDSLDTRRSPNGRYALNWAALNNRVDALRFLLAHGAVVEATNLTGFTALHHAAELGSLDAARFLLGAGADPGHRNKEGLKPADTARERGHDQVAELIEAAERNYRRQP